ncbi:MAG: glucosylceramidase [Salinivirgaceae bacterium]|nr:glucosylceramidase [Salinivirgaceae bacterium]
MKKMKSILTNLDQGLMLILMLAFLDCSPGCSKEDKGSDGDKNPTVTTSELSCWLTTSDQKNLMKKQTESLLFTEKINGYPTIQIDSTVTYQEIDGFGFTLTGGSARLINSLDNETKQNLLTELFAFDSTFIGVSYLRISIGASDLSETDFTYDEMPDGQTDPDLEHFTVDMEQEHLIPLLKMVLEINPDIKILGSPWTAPTWMKTNNAYIGGSLKPEYYTTYANYFVKYIQAMAREGISIDAITIQNEPLHPGNNPSMYMEAADQAVFVKNHLGPVFEAAGIKTKIIIYDHNADKPEYPISILNDPEAKKQVDGSAFHLYGGTISALTQVHNAHPDKNLYFTEQWVGGPSNFSGDLSWHVENLIIGGPRNWCRTVLEWNLASDPDYQPHTEGGCTNCLGALTIANRVSRNVAYYIIAHASKFVRPGSVRIASNIPENLNNVAFLTPTGKKVLIVLNNSGIEKKFNIRFKSNQATTSLPSGAVATYIW